MLNLVTIKEVKEELGRWCKLERLKYDISQEQLAEHLDMSRYTIQKFETGKNATVDTVLKIANHFDAIEPFYQSLKSYNDQNQTDSLY